jgi:hypothetical protein
MMNEGGGGAASMATLLAIQWVMVDHPVLAE